MSWAAVLGAGINATSDMVTNIWNQVNQNRAWRREDTAIQRRVADLKAAGLSPVLAAGQAAQSQGPITHKPAHFDIGAVLEATRLKMDKDRNDAEIDNIKADTQTKEIENRARGRGLLLEQAMLEERIKHTQAETRLHGLDGMYKEQEIEMKQLDIDNWHIELAKRTLQNEELYNRLNLQKKELAEREVAIMLQRHYLDAYRHSGTAPGLSMPVQGSQAFARWTYDLLQWLDSLNRR